MDKKATFLIDSNLSRQLNGHRLTTAHILYHLPDHPRLLQEFIWQHLDIAPDFPRLRRFLDYWERKIEGQLHSVRVGSLDLISPGNFQTAEVNLTVN